jgi:impB/mucB/samB family protein
MGTCVETLISAMKPETWSGRTGATELDAPAVTGHGDGMVGELGGVPRPALQTVFGKALGRRIWERARHFAGSGVADEEILGGMIEYVSGRAGEALRENGRQAKAIGLRLEYADGVATLNRMRLARPTNDGGEILVAAMELFDRSEARGVMVESVDLKVTSVQTEPVRERAGGLDYAMVSAAAGVRA